MRHSQDIVKELHALKREAGDMQKSSAAEWQQISREKANSLATEIKIFLTDCRHALALNEAEIERAFAGRAVDDGYGARRRNRDRLLLDVTPPRTERLEDTAPIRTAPSHA
jgi:hypothetical protein